MLSPVKQYPDPGGSTQASAHVMLCLPGHTFTQGFTQSLSKTLRWLCGHPSYTYSTVMAGGSSIPRVRSKLALGTSEMRRDAAPFGGADYDIAMWIDSDMVWEPWQLEMLWQHEDANVVAGVYTTNGGKLTAWWARGLSARYPAAGWMQKVEKAIKDGIMPPLVPVDGIGLGFTMMRKGVLEQLGWPFFPLEQIEEGGYVDLLGEDATFARRCKREGIEVCIDPRVRPKHEKRQRLVVLGEDAQGGREDA